MEDESIYDEKDTNKEKEEMKDTSTELSRSLKEEKNSENKHWMKQANQSVMKQMWKEKRRYYGDYRLFYGDVTMLIAWRRVIAVVIASPIRLACCHKENNNGNGAKGKMIVHHYDNINRKMPTVTRRLERANVSCVCVCEGADNKIKKVHVLLVYTCSIAIEKDFGIWYAFWFE
ncbi:hypothetical protein RFI_02957 [Reticulomyxa filosa]|uniref:Uncharacterized protein n=1 Tax=Reticulomyxa filosa TaxID=46433 RepID=X6P915_RETFI|nr:hypothetical protein RFI_02957 [Reticulomyxa filosa]|eukprot:ETO34137.1 hypothetical protein RFI_02957 [Reticulomyxa filosa]